MENATGKPLGAAIRPSGTVVTALFSPGGQVYAIATDDQAVQVYNTETGAAVGKPLRHRSGVNDVAFRRDGKVLLTVCGEVREVCEAWLWDRATGSSASPWFGLGDVHP